MREIVMRMRAGMAFGILVLFSGAVHDARAGEQFKQEMDCLLATKGLSPVMNSRFAEKDSFQVAEIKGSPYLLQYTSHGIYSKRLSQETMRSPESGFDAALQSGGKVRLYHQFFPGPPATEILRDKVPAGFAGAVTQVELGDDLREETYQRFQASTVGSVESYLAHELRADPQLKFFDVYKKNLKICAEVVKDPRIREAGKKALEALEKMHAQPRFEREGGDGRAGGAN